MTRPLNEIRSVVESSDELVHFAGVRAAVGVDHHDDVAGRCTKPSAQRGALAPPVLVHDHRVGPDAPSEYLRRVRRETIDEQYLIHPWGQILKHPGQTLSLVECGDDDAHGWRLRPRKRAAVR